jgi:hypothetical protein
MAFEYAYDLSGCAYPVIKEFPIVTNTNVSKGEVVALTAGFVVEVDADQDDPVLGVAAENHDGSSTGQTGTSIKVYCSPSAVFKLRATGEAVADSGNTTTMVDASYGTAGDDEFNGGILKLTAKGTSSTLTLPVGKLVAVTDFATTTGTFTGAFTGGTTAGDTYTIFPPVGAHSFDLDAAATNIDLNTTGGEAIQIVENDTDNDHIYVKFRLHEFGAHPIAVS